mmetsp:Transcript_58858/g.104093  ORF Transcript_58858/g.104093 Transcript_58858/m.104093 type:complete len:133 (+) Transcript_58858:274-672(+)
MGLGALHGQTAVVTNCVFYRNSATQMQGDGGGFFMFEVPAMIVTGCHFEGNEADVGGGLYISDGALTVSNSTFLRNFASRAAGAYCTKDATRDEEFVLNHPAIWTNCTFESNECNGIAPSVVFARTTPLHSL